MLPSSQRPVRQRNPRSLGRGGRQKRQAFATGAPPDFINRLFFQARNLAIEAMQLRLENLFLSNGLTAQVCQPFRARYGLC